MSVPGNSPKNKYTLSDEIADFRAELARQRISQADFCEPRGLNYPYFRSMMCGQYDPNEKQLFCIREFMATVRFIDTGNTGPGPIS
jgi:hypothetical protein